MAQESNPRFFSREFSEILVEFTVKYPFLFAPKDIYLSLGRAVWESFFLGEQSVLPISLRLRNPPVNTVERKSFRRGAPLLLLLLPVVEERKGKKN